MNCISPKKFTSEPMIYISVCDCVCVCTYITFWVSGNLSNNIIIMCMQLFYAKFVHHETFKLCRQWIKLTLSESVPLFPMNLLVPLNDNGEYATVNIPLLPTFPSNIL